MLPHRFKHYQRNIGWRTTIINLVILGYLMYLMFGAGIDPVRLFVALLMAAGVLVPRLFLNKMVTNPTRTTKLLGYGTFVILGVFVLDFTGIWTPPALAAITIPPLVGILIGGNFWLFSDPRILTPAGAAHYAAYDIAARQHAARAHDATTQRDNPTPRVR